MLLILFLMLIIGYSGVVSLFRIKISHDREKES